MFEPIIHSFKHSLMITSFVLSMMMLIEYFTIRTQNKLLNIIGKNPWTQVIIASFLGIIPGCLGTFIAVSLYAHKVFNFPALVTVMIASSGDEAFVMLSEIPKEALLLNGILFIVGIAAGFILNLIFKNKNYMVLNDNLLKDHHKPECVAFNKKRFIEEYKNISFQRAMLVVGTFVFLIFLIFGEIGPKNWSEMKISLVIITSIVFFILATVPEHFLVEHLWKHTIKKHIFKIFLWTFGALLLIELFLPMLNITKEAFEPIAKNYFWLILLIAILIGIIPESGPNMVFIFLFASGYIPMSILIANSIVQDGHGGLPLLAESQKSFLYSKGVNIIVGIFAGLAGFVFGF